jgi:hypothetical protein
MQREVRLRAHEPTSFSTPFVAGTPRQIPGSAPIAVGEVVVPPSNAALETVLAAAAAPPPAPAKPAPPPMNSPVQAKSGAETLAQTARVNGDRDSVHRVMTSPGLRHEPQPSGWGESWRSFTGDGNESFFWSGTKGRAR